MKKLIAALALLTLALTGCSTGTYDLSEVSHAKKLCHSLGGVFSVWQNDFGAYLYECDLSDGSK